MSLFDIFKPGKKMKPWRLTKWEEMYYAVDPAEKLNAKALELVCSNPFALWQYEKCVCYLEDKHNPVANALFGKYHEEITRGFKRVGYTFIYAPKEAEEIAKHYGLSMPDVEWNAATLLEMLQCTCGESIGSALVVMDSASLESSVGISVETDNPKEVIAILKALWKGLDKDDDDLRFRLSEDDCRYEARGEKRCMTRNYGEEECNMSSTLFTIDGESAACERDLAERRCEVERSAAPNIMCSVRRNKEPIAYDFCYDVEEVLTEEDEQLLTEIQARVAKLRQRGIKQHLIEKVLKMTVPKSHLEVTPDARILLTDYGQEVQMLPIDKVVYIFYLRHPEGISIKSLADHKEELMVLYARVLGKAELTDKQKASVERLCDPWDNSINEKLSRIRKSFCAEVHESVANHYIIQGSRGADRTITLDEELIVAEVWMR